MGIRRTAYTTDPESSIVALFAALQMHCSGELVPETAQLGESDDDGLAEAAVKTHEGLVRTRKLALERRLGEKIADSHPIMSCIAEWSAMLHRKLRVGPGGAAH